MSMKKSAEQEDRVDEKDPSENLAWTILPSYQMYTNTIYKSLKLPEEDLTKTEPPSYEDSPIFESGESDLSTILSNNAETLSSRSSGTPSMNIIPVTNVNTQTTVDGIGLPQETVVDNIHKLKNLANSNKTSWNSVKISIKFTRDVGVSGKEPVFIDPYTHEYKQGDLINGYLLITNESNDPLRFDIFDVSLEGKFVVVGSLDMDGTKPIKTQRFLQMFDSSASYHRVCCESKIDPLDGTKLSIGKSRILHPKLKYKRFFTFKIPERLLDSECSHSVQSHTLIPPTIGISNAEKTLNSNNKVKNCKAKDFSFVGTSINYEIHARFIGHRPLYNANELSYNDKEKCKDAEYVILKDLMRFIRIVPRSRLMSDTEEIIRTKGNELIYRTLVNRSKAKIDIGRALVRAIETTKVDQVHELAVKFANQSLEMTSDEAKSHQLYNSVKDSCLKRLDGISEKYSLIAPYTKKSLTGTLKHIGTMEVSSPKIKYNLNYIPPEQYRKEKNINTSDLETWKLRIPVDLTFRIPEASSAGRKVPTIKSIQGDLVIDSIKSDGFSIPIEIDHDLLFQNVLKVNELDDQDHHDQDFSSIIKNQFKNYHSEILEILKKLPQNTFKIETELMRDITCLAGVKEKKMNLEIDNLAYQIPGGKQLPASAKNLANIEWRKLGDEIKTCESSGLTAYGCTFDLILDVVTAHYKGNGKFNKYNSYDSFFFVPSFQTCSMARLYYVKLAITFSSGDVVHLKIPVDFEKYDS